jgi:TRAP-type C4-dicarboxylate transport system permease small subunit
MHNTDAGAGGSTATQRFRDHYGLFLEWVVMVLMVLLAVEVTAGVVFRAIGQSLVWYDEVASVMLAWLTFYGSALASVKRAHIGCPEVVEKMSPGWKRALNIVSQVLVIAFFTLLGWVGLQILPMIASDTLVSLPEVSMAIVQSVIPISAALIVVAEVTHLIDLVLARPQAVSAAALADGLH